MQSSAAFSETSKLPVWFSLICYQILTPPPKSRLALVLYLEMILNLRSSCIQYRLVINMSHQVRFYKVQGSRLRPGLSTCEESTLRNELYSGPLLFFLFCLRNKGLLLRLALNSVSDDLPTSASQVSWVYWVLVITPGKFFVDT